jgi:hypothetical protein
MALPSALLLLHLLRALPAVASSSTILDLDDNSVTVGGAHACALERVDEMSIGGEVVCWGDGAGGALDSPAGLFVQLSASGATTCGVTIEQRVQCWGSSRAVVSPAGASAAALQVAAHLQVSVGARHACAIASDGGALTCWGDDAGGAVSGAPAGAAAQVSCGGGACCALLVRGGGGGGLDAACWGAAAGGVLAPPPGVAFLQVSVAADGHACGIAADYRLWCWGSFIAPAGGSSSWNGTFVQVAASEGVTCALRGDGTLKCLGEERRLWSGRPTRGAHDAAPRAPPARDAQFSEISAQCVGGDVAKSRMALSHTLTPSSAPHPFPVASTCAGFPLAACGASCALATRAISRSSRTTSSPRAFPN